MSVDLAVKKTPTDFKTLYSSSHRLAQNKSAYYKEDHAHSTNLCPPFLTALIAPITLHFDYTQTFLAWSLLSCALFAVALGLGYFCFRHSREGDNRAMYQSPESSAGGHLSESQNLDNKKHTNNTEVIKLLSTITLGFLFSFTFFNITFGQVALTLAFLTTLIWIALKNSYPITAGCLLGITINIKLFFGFLFLFLLIKKHYRACIACITAILTINTILLLIYGPSIFINYISTLHHVYWYQANWNASIYGFFSRIFGSPMPKITSLLYYPKLSFGLYAFSSLLITFFSLRAIMKSSSLDFSFCLSLVTMLLVSPLGWAYYFPLLFIPVFFLLKEARSMKQPSLMQLGVSAVLFLASLPYPLMQTVTVPKNILLTWHSTPFYALFLLWVIMFTLPNKARSLTTGPALPRPILSLALFTALSPGIAAIVMTMVKWY